MGSPADQLLADDLRVASYVPTRQAPSSRGFFTKGPHKASRQISLPPRNKFGFFKRTHKKWTKETSPSGPHPTPDDGSRKENRRIVKELTTVKKQDPNLVSEMSDSLVKRLDKLRLQRTASSSHYRKDASVPEPHHRTADAAEKAQNNMATPKIRRPASGERSHSSSRQRTQRSTGVVVIDDEIEDEMTVSPQRPNANFSSTNFFQSTDPRNQSSNRRRSRIDGRLEKKPAPRSRSPYSSDSSSDAMLTPESSEASYGDLSSPATHFFQFFQEEQDLLLAHRLQDEEVGLHARDSERPNETQQDAVENAPSRRTSSKSKVHRKRVHSSKKRTVAPRGAQANPISIDSEPDEPRATLPERARIQDYVALHGEPMDIDGMDQFKPRHAKRSRSIPTKRRDSERKEPKRSRNCVVCDESVQIVDLPSLANCDHQPETCIDCYSGWIVAQLQDSGWREVACPGNGCKVKLSYQEIQAYASPETFQQYDTFIARAAFSDDPNFRWCRACDSGQIHLSGVEGNIFTCVACGHKVCIVHENTWHEGETCEEFEYRSSGRKEQDQRAQEEASLEAIGKLTKKCPGPGCTWNIEKNDGCDHMTCKFNKSVKESLPNLFRFKMPA
ncbi:IBR domain containing protein [Pyrenophora teres f. teres]|uniref:RBR-type E3 ubiquitin transferase n=1 Tax=Pyrenophora teres f. teres TaxID=97479 RepID=A0A6S6WCP2_9PLEO|nr:IBR domain containing protein [Pyrenophora teres f. teres]